MNQNPAQTRGRLAVVLLGNALTRIAGSASGILIGLYLADLVKQGRTVDAVLVGTLAAVSFAAELLGALPLGLMSDVLTPRALMILGSLLGAAATQIFGLSENVAVFFVSRAIEGLAVAACGPAVLAHLTDVTDGDDDFRGKAMSYFELSLLGGLALGGLVGGSLWKVLGVRAFAAVAAVYLVCAGLFAVSAVGSRKHGTEQAFTGLVKALEDPMLRRLAPAWLCINTIVGLWLSPTFPFLLTVEDRRGQFITGAFVGKPEQVGVVFLIYAVVFAVGVTIWSFFLARFPRRTVLRIALVAMFVVCAGLFALNHAGGYPAWVRWSIGTVTALTIMVESGFTPAALALLADVVGAQGGRGAAMGIYSVLLSLAALVGSFFSGLLAQWRAVDGLILGTVVMAGIAFIALTFLPATPPKPVSSQLPERR